MGAAQGSSLTTRKLSASSCRVQSRPLLWEMLVPPGTHFSVGGGLFPAAWSALLSADTTPLLLSVCKHLLPLCDLLLYPVCHVLINKVLSVNVLIVTLINLSSRLGTFCVLFKHVFPTQ